jgi:hypothetical protein
MELSEILAKIVAQNVRTSLHFGVVTAISNATGNNYLTIELAGGTTPITNVRYLQSYVPEVNDTVLVQINKSDIYVIDSFAKASSKRQPYYWSVEPLFVSGRYYTTDANVGTGSALTANRAHAIPFWVHTQTTFDRIGIRVTTGVAATTIRLGIYDSNSSRFPNNLVLDAGTVDSSASTTNREITISETLNTGLYFLVACAQGGTPSVQNIGNVPLSLVNLSSYGFASIPTNQALSSTPSETGVTGALPDPWTSTGLNIGGPRVFLRVA